MSFLDDETHTFKGLRSGGFRGVASLDSVGLPTNIFAANRSP